MANLEQRSASHIPATAPGITVRESASGRARVGGAVQIEEALMIRLTERAAYGLKEILTANRTPNDHGIKLVPAERGGVTMTIDRPGEGDSIVDGGKRPLLIVDASLTDRLDGVVLDYAREDMGNEEPQFVFRREG